MRQEGGMAWGWMAFAVVLPLAYVLSIGPVACLCDRIEPSGRTLDVLEALYFPLEWVYEQTPLQAPLDAYLSWWRGLGRSGLRTSP
jgi:hypothetical protein